MTRKPDDTSLQRRVDEAAEKLLAAGIRPTVQLIHEAIGKSPRSLGPLLEDWRIRLAARKPVRADLPATAIPEERAEAVVREAIDSARGSLRKRLRSTRQRLRTLATRAPERGLVSRAELDRLLRDLLEIQSQLGAHASRLEETRAGIATLEKRAATVVRALQLLMTSTRGAEPRGRG